jgi:hypothetical protein
MIARKESDKLYDDNWLKFYKGLEDLEQKIVQASEAGSYQLFVEFGDIQTLQEVHYLLQEENYSVDNYNGEYLILEIQWG